MPPRDHPRRLPGADAGPARGLRPGREGRRRPPERAGRHHHGAARLRAGDAPEADLQFRPADGQERQAGAAARPTWQRWRRAAARRSSSRSGSSRWRRWRRRCEQFGPLQYHGKVPHKDRQAILDRFKRDPTQARHADELRHRQRRAEPAVHQLRVSVRSLVEPRRRGPGDQPRPPPRPEGAGVRDALRDARAPSKAASRRCWRRKGSCSTS